MDLSYHSAFSEEARSEIIKVAEESGSTWEEVKAYAGGSFAEAPIDTTLNALGTSAPTLVGWSG